MPRRRRRHSRVRRRGLKLPVKVGRTTMHSLSAKRAVSKKFVKGF